MRFFIVLLVLAHAAFAADPLSKRLTEKLVAAGVKIDGVSPGDDNDKSTWRIDFAKDATNADRAAAKAIVDAWNVKDEGDAAVRAEKRAKLYRERAQLDAIEGELALRPDDAEMVAERDAQKAVVEKLRKELTQ